MTTPAKMQIFQLSGLPVNQFANGNLRDHSQSHAKQDNMP